MEHQLKKRSRAHENDDQNSHLTSNSSEVLTEPQDNNNSNR